MGDYAPGPTAGCEWPAGRDDHSMYERASLNNPLRTYGAPDRLAQQRWPRTRLMVELREKLTTEKLKTWLDRMLKEMEQEAERDA